METGRSSNLENGLVSGQGVIFTDNLRAWGNDTNQDHESEGTILSRFPIPENLSEYFEGFDFEKNLDQPQSSTTSSE